METNDIVDRYRRAQDAFDAVLAKVPQHGWDSASACELWTVRDVVGHVVWGLEVLRHHATGQEYTERTGPPGSENPGELAGDDALAGWRAAREATAAVLTDELIDGPAPQRFLANRPDAKVTDVLELMTFDTVVHTWDIGSALGMDVQLEPDLVARSFSLARLVITRTPTTFGPRVPPPPGADAQAKLLTFVGRKV
ncbi:TIGR03086 family metal-binding protein [Allokutzneria sp. A3M-2-11 16]|uniref:TIGR03086 family metal-binding protein n=1 Tax=Allokutzneria sp. A3M-2-11 16 TaxID=2962043 RepID=UPI0020B7CDA4|nr:TIGR03086 family metal-binding protein [Allokutzneria sp. A3M-2-11 16]MCP3800876.1 TIGR03086 family metal-binding protein [Allokutzneria sp. A3M-2-11 16]